MSLTFLDLKLYFFHWFWSHIDQFYPYHFQCPYYYCQVFASQPPSHNGSFDLFLEVGWDCLSLALILLSKYAAVLQFFLLMVNLLVLLLFLKSVVYILSTVIYFLGGNVCLRLIFINNPLARFLMMSVSVWTELWKIYITVMTAVPCVSCFLIEILLLCFLLLLLLSVALP